MQSFAATVGDPEISHSFILLTEPPLGSSIIDNVNNPLKSNRLLSGRLAVVYDLPSMADNKNQHYVPKCHLRPFSVDGEGAAINLYNIRADRPIPNASIRGQCSSNYFYGEEPKFEALLQNMEGKYAAAVARLSEKPRQAPEDTLRFLRDFALLQHNRTAKAVARRRASLEAMHEVSTRPAKNAKNIKIDEVDLSHRAMVLGNLQTFAKGRASLDDLRVAIISNETDVDFITSDDPAIFTNRVHLQTLKLDSFGWEACRVQLFLPLTPKLALVAYDKDAYAAPRRRGSWLPVTKANDVLALNEAQYLNCEGNIYFSRWDDRDRIAGEFKAVAAHRIAITHRLWVGAKVGDSRDGEFYCRATEEETAKLGTKIVGIWPVFPVPQRWFGGLPFRDKVIGWFPQSGTALFREATAYKRRFGMRFKRLRVQPGMDILTGAQGPDTALHKHAPEVLTKGSRR